ncbi:hypothetical protein SAMN05216593_12934 [Pseudomonas asturiensis]|uniref:Uncharacterized protein n=1 Tax=Pseudomonas asturiensis TaxID=1190415 RepID=A0A1M7QJ27_9PSED|nr:hypothetical protein SAMN05216593_12934 [Pseudomonas asturiensis]
MRRTGLIHAIHRRLRIHHHHGNRIAIDRHRAAIAAVVATVLQRFEIEAGFFVKDAPINLLRSGGESQFARHPALFSENGLMQRALRAFPPGFPC